MKLKNLALMALVAAPMFAQSTTSSGGSITITPQAFAVLALGIAAFGGALGQGRVVAGVAEAIGRNPSAAGKLQLPLLLGLAFVESLVLFTWLIVNGVK